MLVPIILVASVLSIGSALPEWQNHNCTTKGVIGDDCEKCDAQNHYFGDPINDFCFYDLAIDYQFTFNMSKPEDKNYNAINMKIAPTKSEVANKLLTKLKKSLQHLPMQLYGCTY